MSLEKYTNLLNSYAPTLFKLGSNVAMPAWVALAIRPESRWTERAVAFAIAVNSLIYVATVPGLFAPNPAAAAGGDKPSFSTLRGVTALFRTANASGVTAAWLHYVAFDLLTGYTIAQDALANGIHKAVAAVCLLSTLMLGPTGLVVYGLARLATNANTKFLPWIRLLD